MSGLVTSCFFIKPVIVRLMMAIISKTPMSALYANTRCFYTVMICNIHEILSTQNMITKYILSVINLKEGDALPK